MISYPANDLQQPSTLFGLFGAFWSRIYALRDYLTSHAAARGELYFQAVNDLAETAAATCRYLCPVFHTERRCGVTFFAGSQTVHPSYPKLPAWPVPDDLVDAGTAGNRLGVERGGVFDASPTFLTRGIDFWIDNRLVVFSRNPFDDARFPQSTVFVEGSPTDISVRVWFQDASFDRRHIFHHWGYAAGINATSSAAFRDLINAVFDAAIGGSTALQLGSLLSAITGVPLAKADEKVDAALVDRRRLRIVTETGVYSFSKHANLLTAAGETQEEADRRILEAIEKFVAVVGDARS